MVAFLNNSLLFLEFDQPTEATRVLDRGCRSFKGGVMELDRWSSALGCVKKKIDCLKEA